jgi:hypothetical protein
MTSGVSAVGCIGLFGRVAETSRTPRAPTILGARTSRHALLRTTRSAATAEDEGAELNESRAPLRAASLRQGFQPPERPNAANHPPPGPTAGA